MTSRSKGDPTDHSERQIISCPWQGGGGGRRGEESGCQLELLDMVKNDGVFSTVYRCQDTATSKPYLVKRVYLHRLGTRDIEYRLKEIPIWTGLRHRHILTCFTGWRSGAELWLLSESATDTVERGIKEKALPPPQPLYENWLYQLASALQYLHEFQEKPIMHRNLKPGNIMVVAHYILKLTDFGFSKELEDGQEMTQSCVGTPRIMSPEMVNKQPYSTKTDMWSLGITAVYIATLQNAIGARSFETLVEKIRQGQVRSITGQYSPDIDQLVHSLLQINPNLRPSASHFLTDLRLCSNHCDTPPTAHSYPGRQMVPQKTRRATSSKTPASRQRPEPRSVDPHLQGHMSLPVRAQNKEEKSPAFSENRGGTARKSPLKKIPKSAMLEKRSSASHSTPSLLLRDDKQLGTPASPDDAAPGYNASLTIESLSRSLLDMALSETDSRAGMELGAQNRELRHQHLRDRNTEQCQSLTAAAAAALQQEGTLTRIAEVIHKRGSAKNRDVASDDKIPKASRRKASVSSQQLHGKNCASTARTISLTNSVCEREPTSSTRRHSEGNQYTSREECPLTSNPQAHYERLPAPSQRQNRGGKHDSTEKGVPVHERTTATHRDSADKSASAYTRPPDEQDTHRAQSTERLVSDSLTPAPEMINTFPGAFNMDRDLPASPYLTVQHTPTAGESDRSHRTSHCDNASTNATGVRGTAQSGPGLHTSTLSDAPIDSWPESMREYWFLAEDLMKRLGSDTFFTALKYTIWFTEDEVRKWLRERGVDSADQCLDDLRRLTELDAGLDEDAVRTVNQTLRCLPRSKDGRT